MLINKEITKEKKWIIKSVESTEALASIRKIATELSIDPIIAKLLYIRGYCDTESARSFIRMEREMLRNPFAMKDMDKAVARIERALSLGEKITVYGDYDVDGVTSVCTLYLYLKSLGATVDYYIPNRSGEGYGVSTSAIEGIKESGTTLIITVDTGITANEEVDFAKSIGVDFLITDHHECRAELPNATAVINPHRPDCTYPFKELAGVGVVFKLICAFEESHFKADRLTSNLKLIKKYADLVAIGTIADVMPIKEENRVIVKYGLSMIENTSRVGLAALIEAASGKNDKGRDRTDKGTKKKRKTKITSGYISFTLAPRINAAGRVRSATKAVELFLSNDYDEAIAIAEELCEANRERQAEENKIMLEANDKIKEIDLESSPVIVLDSDNWHHGVIGIVSSRITEKYNHPSILISFEGNPADTPEGKEVGKGSGRSIKGLNLVDALCYCSEHLVKFGGHELAAGLSVTREELPTFTRLINEYALKNLSECEMYPTIETDCEIEFSDISLSLAESLQTLEPYGVGNPIPMFVVRNVTLMELVGISEGKHSKMMLGDGERAVSAMYFSNSPDSLGVSVGDRVDVLFSIDINIWQDRKSVQMVVRDLKPSLTQETRDEAERRRFNEIKGGASFTEEESIYPDRRDFAATYGFIEASIRDGHSTFSHKDLLAKIYSKYNVRINYIKMKFIIMIFMEINLLGIEEYDNEQYKFSIHYSQSKKNLDKSTILKRLRSQMR